jgi:hypothetical protein
VVLFMELGESEPIEQVRRWVEIGIEMSRLRGHREDRACRKTSPVEKGKRFESSANHGH